MFAVAAPPTVPSLCADPAFARDVAEGLALEQKSIPASWLYDAIGSALFEVITLLPEYGLTRADAALLGSCAHEVIAGAGNPRLIVELGSGSGTKTRYLLNAASERNKSIDYMPIDISRAALESCQASLGSISGVSVRPIEGTYLEGIGKALAHRRSEDRALILFLGSTIGNFTRPEAEAFLHSLRQCMGPGDSLLLGADLVKPREKLIEAYDDAAGVTAAFNLNLLGRINRELGGEFRLDRFAHETRFNERFSRVEMHLRSRVPQTVRIAALDLEVRFRKGETIWTESSHKFNAEEVAWLGENAGWHTVRQWFENNWGFSETLFDVRG